MAKLNKEWFTTPKRTAYGQSTPAGHTKSEPLLRCPICEAGCVRLTAVERYPAGESKSRVIITSEGLAVRLTKETYGPRGAGIVLRFYCEQGHEFSYLFKLHKGSKLPERQVWDSLGTNEVQIIWRD